MKEKFIKFKTGQDEVYVIPQMITHVKKMKNGKAVVYLFNGQSLYPDEPADDVIKIIKESDIIKMKYDQNI